jgi:hypothetical protein
MRVCYFLRFCKHPSMQIPGTKNSRSALRGSHISISKRVRHLAIKNRLLGGNLFVSQTNPLALGLHMKRLKNQCTNLWHKSKCRDSRISVGWSVGPRYSAGGKRNLSVRCMRLPEHTLGYEDKQKPPNPSSRAKKACCCNIALAKSDIHSTARAAR